MPCCPFHRSLNSRYRGVGSSLQAVVTFTVTVQELFTAILPPVSVTLPEPATAVAVPPHVFVNPFGVATTRPAGKYR